MRSTQHNNSTQNTEQPGGNCQVTIPDIRLNQRKKIRGELVAWQWSPTRTKQAAAQFRTANTTQHTNIKHTKMPPRTFPGKHAAQRRAAQNERRLTVVVIGLRYWPSVSNEYTKAPLLSPWNCPKPQEPPQP